MDANILRDFGELKYYLDKSFEESLNFQDSESKAFFMYHSACLELQLSNDLEKCQSMVNLSLKHLNSSTQLSFDSQLLYLKLKLLQVDIGCSVSLRSGPSQGNYLVDLFKSLFLIHEYVLDKLKCVDGKFFWWILDALTKTIQ